MSERKGSKIGYWVTTGLFCAALGLSGVGNLVGPPEITEAITELGYPLHILTLLGLLKIAGVVTLLVPGFRRLKEWAYAGLFFDLAGAVWSHAYVGDPIAQWGMILVFIALLFASYFLRPADRKLA